MPADERSVPNDFIRSIVAADLAAGSVAEVGTGSTVAPANTDMSEMTISPDGGTLFLVGTTSVVITPAPYTPP